MDQFEMYLKVFLDDEDACEVRNHAEAICDNCPAASYCSPDMCVIREAANRAIEILDDRNGWLYRMYA